MFCVLSSAFCSHWRHVHQLCGYRITASISAFQAEGGGSTPPIRSSAGIMRRTLSANRRSIIDRDQSFSLPHPRHAPKRACTYPWHPGSRWVTPKGDMEGTGAILSCNDRPRSLPARGGPAGRNDCLPNGSGTNCPALVWRQQTGGPDCRKDTAAIPSWCQVAQVLNAEPWVQVPLWQKRGMKGDRGYPFMQKTPQMFARRGHGGHEQLLAGWHRHEWSDAGTAATNWAGEGPAGGGPNSRKDTAAANHDAR